MPAVLRVKDIEAAYADWSARGAQFLTPPKQHPYEVRCYIHDPDGHLIEVGQTKKTEPVRPPKSPTITLGASQFAWTQHPEASAIATVGARWGHAGGTDRCARCVVRRAAIGDRRCRPGGVGRDLGRSQT